MSPLDVFKPGDDFYQAVEALVGKDEAATARRLWERMLDRCVDAVIPNLRSQRYAFLYLSDCFDLLFDYIGSRVCGYSFEDAIAGKKTPPAPNPVDGDVAKIAPETTLWLIRFLRG